jgi:hypothetical protein
MGQEKYKEHLSIAYLRAVAAQSKIDYVFCNEDDDGVDCYLKKEIIRTDNSEFSSEFKVQLKSTASSNIYRESDTEIIYNLKGKTYNDLQRHRKSQLYLFLLILPQDETDWVKCNINELVMKKCMFWYKYNEAQENHVEDDSTKAIHIPKTNLITPTELERLLNLEGDNL